MNGSTRYSLFGGHTGGGQRVGEEAQGDPGLCVLVCVFIVDSTKTSSRSSKTMATLVRKLAQL